MSSYNFSVPSKRSPPCFSALQSARCTNGSSHLRCVLPSTPTCRVHSCVDGRITRFAKRSVDSASLNNGVNTLIYLCSLYFMKIPSLYICRLSYFKHGFHSVSPLATRCDFHRSGFGRSRGLFESRGFDQFQVPFKPKKSTKCFI